MRFSDPPASPTPPPQTCGRGSLLSFIQLQPTLASLYWTSPLDLDSERLDRYSVPPPPPGRNSVTSLASSSSLTGSDHRASVRATSAVPFFAPVYSIGKDKWEPEEDDFLHEYEGKNPRVGPAFLIEETAAFRGGSHWGLRGVANTLAMLLLVLAIVGVFLGEESSGAPAVGYTRRANSFAFIIEAIPSLSTSCHALMSTQRATLTEGIQQPHPQQLVALRP